MRIWKTFNKWPSCCKPVPAVSLVFFQLLIAFRFFWDSNTQVTLTLTSRFSGVYSKDGLWFIRIEAAIFEYIILCACTNKWIIDMRVQCWELLFLKPWQQDWHFISLYCRIVIFPVIELKQKRIYLGWNVLSIEMLPAVNDKTELKRDRWKYKYIWMAVKETVNVSEIRAENKIALDLKKGLI